MINFGVRGQRSRSQEVEDGFVSQAEASFWTPWVEHVFWLFRNLHATYLVVGAGSSDCSFFSVCHVYIPETVYGHISGINRKGRRCCRCVFLAQSDSVVSEIYTDLKGGHVTDIQFVEENAGHTQKLLSPKMQVFELP